MEEQTTSFKGRHFLALILGITFFIGSCKNHIYSPKVRAALDQAGANRKQLKKVLVHYSKDPADSLKLRAAEFLIGNMPGQVSYRGKGLTFEGNGRNSLEVFAENAGNFHRRIPTNLKHLYKNLHMDQIQGTLHLREDLTFISGSYLIDNIDQAFDAWHAYPWSKNISFNQFCNYILPYNVLDEPPSRWRRKIRRKFRGMVDSLDHPDSLLEATAYINSHLPHRVRFNNTMMKIPPAFGFGELGQLPVGSCDQQVTYQAYVLRAMGIPVRVDYVPFWANHRVGHSWLSVKNPSDSLAIAFNAMHNFKRPYGHIPLVGKRASKIFRRSYQRRGERTNSKNRGDVPPIYARHHSLDVTGQYQLPTRNLSIRADSDYHQKMAYLSVFSGNRWRITDRGNRQGGRYRFHHVGTGVVYLPVGYQQYRASPISNPILVDKQKNVHLLAPDTARNHTIRISRKYPVRPYLKKALKQMVGGVFQGANRRDFSDARTLYRIKDMPRPKTNRYDFYNTGSYQYLRFKLPNGQCRVAEMHFVRARQGQEDPTPLHGQLISSVPAGDKPVANITDKDVLSYFVAAADSGGWAGIDLGRPKHVNGVQFYPPNDGNSVEKGDTYNLFFWDDGWKSKWQKQRAKGEQLIFRDAPAHALFILRDLTKGKDERIFTYNHGHPHWY